MTNNDLIDIAYGKPCEQSSLSKWSKNYKANGVTLDLQYGETFGFHTDITDNFPYLLVDLLWVYPIDSIIVYNRMDDHFIDRAKTLFIEFSDDKEHWRTLHTGIIYFSYAHPFEMPLLSKISARYIRFSLKEREYLHLYKIKIFMEYSNLLKVEAHNYKIYNKSLNPNHDIRAIILGTSNSLLYMGYSYELTYNNLKLIKNISLGSSHATVIPFRLKLIENIDTDILILDILLNEQRAFSKKLYNISMAEELFLMFITYCATKSITPIVLLMPEINCMNTNINLKKDSIYCKIKENYLYLCKKHSIAFFDGYEFLDGISFQLKRTKKSFFKDPLHLNKFAAQLLGSNLSSSIQKEYEKLRDSKKIKRESYNFYFFDIKPYAPRRIKRETSLMKVTLAQLKENDIIKIPVPSKNILVGFVLNMYKSYASLKITTGGNKSIIKRLDSDQYSKERNLALVSWSLINPIIIEDNYLQLKVVPSIENENYELNDHCQKKIDNNDCVLEIEGLIFKSTEKIYSSTTCSAYINLTSAQLTF